MEENKAKQIAAVNDAFRKVLMSGQVILTAGIARMSFADRAAIANKILDYDDFTSDTDPYEEHEFGTLWHNDEVIFWKFDIYADSNMQKEAKDYTDPNAYRVLTITLAEEF